MMGDAMTPVIKEELQAELMKIAQLAYDNELISGGRYREIRKMCGLDPWDYDREGL